MKNEDVIVEIKMYFNRIFSLVDLLMQNSFDKNTHNLMTIMELAELGLSKVANLDKQWLFYGDI